MIILAVISYCATFSTREYYGPVKNVQKIPLTDCYRKCSVWTDRCFRDRPYDLYRCQRMGQACRDECYYSNSHRQ